MDFTLHNGPVERLTEEQRPLGYLGCGGIGGSDQRGKDKGFRLIKAVRILSE
jgi:hypothetical protein